VQQSYQAPAQQTYQQPVAGAVRMGADRDWTIQGGTPVTVGQTDSLNTISLRYGVPASAIVASNGLSPTQPLSPGQKIVIPVFRRAGEGAPRTVSAPVSSAEPTVTAAAAPRRAGSGASHTVSTGETLFSLARSYGVSHRDIASANGLAPDAQLRVGQSVMIPGATQRPVAQTKPAQQPISSAYAPAAQIPSAVAKPTQPIQQATNPQVSQQPEVQTPPMQQGAQEAKVQPVVARPQEVPTTAAAAVGPAETGKPDFRWPVRGRVISGYGSKPNGKANDGINLAVPEGTPVRAAESGTVAYAGSELQGYGNLVLVRHADGWVTAYAHASDLLVKKGDVVRRGQVIARAGRSGDVSAPQLHFEVRRGSNPVDPLEHLPRS
jgi:murein DD-endopeptidase MepM/ murein hydrolase activator NlpD